MLPPTAMPAPMLGALELTGRSRTHVRELAEPQCMLHPDALVALLALRTAARGAGIELLPVSSFRDFDAQRAIWNGKYRGERPLLDRDNRPLVAARLPPAERVAAILCWSALPGASRHHWGSDFDVIDRNALPAGERVQLLDGEYAAGGRYARLSAWLAAHAADYGFFHPYDSDRGGVLPEPWHLSYAPVAQPALAALTPALLAAALAGADIEGWEVIAPRLPEYHERYVAAVAAVPGAALVARALSRAARPA